MFCETGDSATNFLFSPFNFPSLPFQRIVLVLTHNFQTNLVIFLVTPSQSKPWMVFSPVKHCMKEKLDHFQEMLPSCWRFHPAASVLGLFQGSHRKANVRKQMDWLKIFVKLPVQKKVTKLKFKSLLWEHFALEGACILTKDNCGACVCLAGW